MRCLPPSTVIGVPIAFAGRPGLSATADTSGTMTRLRGQGANGPATRGVLDDCLVAAAAHAAAAVLATGNPRHFPMTEIEVEHWPVGE